MDITERLTEQGFLVATYLPSSDPPLTRGWLYPECTTHSTACMAMVAHTQGLTMHLLKWPHPRQQWAVFAKPGFDTSIIAPWVMEAEPTAPVALR
jgi:hypothetical protein